MLLYNKQKKSQNAKVNRFLVSINVLGSAGPIRFVVKEDDLVANVIDNTLKCYAREGRLPVLGADLKDFVLYCPHAAAEALNQWETIGSTGARNFILCKKPKSLVMGDGREKSANTPLAANRKANGSWRAWLNKSLGLMVPSH